MQPDGLPYAEDVNYWRTGRSSPDVWVERAKDSIEALGATILGEGFGRDQHGKAAYMLAFQIDGDPFKILWPVVPSKSGDEKAARIQAATMLYHYVKAVCLYAVVMGARPAFFSHLMLPDGSGRVASEVAGSELAGVIPQMLRLNSPSP
jgi:hypothetical protein